jgi:hypothetical protein
MEQVGAVEANYREPGAPREEPKAPPGPPLRGLKLHGALLLLEGLTLASFYLAKEDGGGGSLAGFWAFIFVLFFCGPFALHALLSTAVIAGLRWFSRAKPLQVVLAHAGWFGWLIWLYGQGWFES